MVANLETRCASCMKWGGRQFRVALRPAEIPVSREPGPRLNPQLRRIPAEMRAELTSTEIAMSGSYFDDVLRKPRRYGIENTTDKLRRPGAVRRRRAAVCTESMVGDSDNSPKRSGSMHDGRPITSISRLVAGSPGNAAFDRGAPTSGSRICRTVGEEFPAASLWPPLPSFPSQEPGYLRTPC